MSAVLTGTSQRRWEFTAEQMRVFNADKLIAIKMNNSKPLSSKQLGDLVDNFGNKYHLTYTEPTYSNNGITAYSPPHIWKNMGFNTNTLIWTPTTGTATTTFNTIENKRKNLKNDQQVIPDTLVGYRWNLPPHAWSMPLYSTDLTRYANSRSMELSSDPTAIAANDSYLNVARSPYRRGRIRWRASNLKQKYQVKRPDGSSDLVSAKAQLDNRRYGFQFMWNPESFSSWTGLNLSVTPSLNDQWATAPGYFPGVESISVTVRLDRTNDFACFRGMKSLPFEGELSSTWYPDTMPNQFTIGNAQDGKDRSNETMVAKVQNMLKVGTMADLEYLYRAANDVNVASRTHNVYGENFTTADIGFLAASLITIELGPLSYVGYITGLQVNHIAFTEDYIPIRTDVTITINCMATAESTAVSTEDTSK